MRHGSSNRRQRNRGNGGRQNQKSQVYDSNGPEVRIRGTAHQVAEKYMALAKDAASAGDRIMAQNYLQHAEHYQRIINSWGEDVRSGENKQDRSEKPKEGNGNKADSKEDLSLPSSILGASSNVKSEEQAAQRTSEVVAG